MRTFSIASALAILPMPAIAGPTIFVATLGETANGFKDLAECEIALRASTKNGQALANQSHPVASSVARGSLFNRTHGNASRCETVQGEPVIVVYPKGAYSKSER